jgi:hypothetical protein
MSQIIATAVVCAGLLSVLLFPVTARALLRRRSHRAAEREPEVSPG